MSGGPAQVTADRDLRPTVTCPHCSTKFSPGRGQIVPDRCLGCRAPYAFTEAARERLDVLCLPDVAAGAA